MTPQEKSHELYREYLKLWSYADITPTHKQVYETHIYKYYAKKCALIAVDEILNQDKDAFDITEAEYHFTYWSEVKNEIEKL